MLRALTILLLLYPLTLLAQASQRIASMNVCVDQLLLQLVARERIASLSYLAIDPAYSALAAEAAGLPLNRGLAEEIITLHPDLVLTGPFSASQAANLLARQGYPVTRLGFVASIDDAMQQILQVGALTDTLDQATALTTRLQTGMRASQTRLQPVLAGHTAIFFSNNGVVYGSGTLQDSFLHSLGMHNVAADAGLTGPGQLALETVIAAAPDFIFSHPGATLDQQLAHPLLMHPVWLQLAPASRRIALQDTWFDCAGPRLLRAYQALEEALL